ncbi:MAG: tetratricopeptide repeat protein [candidate division Zixibacteria bacterium]|nr:tetratricopeptide repeat protein [candidate division Zixibacteria bacterium]
MNDQNRELQRERIAAALAVGVWGVLLAGAAFAPESRLWGINFLAFAGTPVRWGFAVALVLVISFQFVGDRLPNIISKIPTGRSLISNRRLLGIGLVAAVAILGWLLHEREAFLGDGTLRADDAVHGAWLIPSESLATMLAAALARHLPSAWGIDGFAAYAIVSVASGVLLAVGLWWLAPKISDGRSGGLIFWLLTFGTVRLLAGYVESYAPAYVAITLWAVAALAYRRGRLNPGWVIGLWVLAVISHLFSILLLPATLWLCWVGPADHSRPARRPLFVLAAAALVFAGTEIWAVYRFQMAQFGMQTSHFLLPLLPRPPHHYGIVSLAHFLDFLNQWFLLAPGFLIAVALTLLLRRDDWRVAALPQSVHDFVHSDMAFWSLAALAPLFAGSWIEPQLGWGRDWDLFCVLFAPTLVGIAIWLNSLGGAIRRAAAGTAVLAAALWLSFSVDADAERHRFEALLDLDPTRADYGHEIMGQYYRRHDEYPQAILHYQKALMVSDNHRYRINIAAAYMHMEQFGDAQRWYRDVLGRDSANPSALQGMSLALDRSERPDEALAYAKRALATDPKDPDYACEVGTLLVQLKQFSEALPYLETAVRARPPSAVRLNGLGVCYLMLGRAAESQTCFEEALRLSPDETVIWLSAARAAMARQNFAESRRLLQQYEARTVPAQRAAEAARLADTLRKVGAYP